MAGRDPSRHPAGLISRFIFKIFLPWSPIYPKDLNNSGDQPKFVTWYHCCPVKKHIEIEKA